MNYNLKRIICIMICGIMMILSLTACNKQTEGTEKEETVEESQTELETIEEQVLFDENGVKVTAVGIVDTENYGKGMVFRCENNNIKSLIFNCTKFLVNGIATPDLFGDQVQPGQTLEITGYFGTGMYEYLDIDNIGEVTVVFDCFDANYESVYTSEDLVIKTSAYDEMDTEYKFDGEELFSDYGLTIYGKIANDEVFENAVLYLVECDIDEAYMFKAESMTINGEVYEQLFAEKIEPNSTALLYYEYPDAEIELENCQIEFEVFRREDVSLVGTTGVMEITNK